MTDISNILYSTYQEAISNCSNWEEITLVNNFFAQPNAAAIEGIPKEPVSMPDIPQNKFLNDGIYIIYKEGSYFKYESKKILQPSEVKGIGVVFQGHSFGVSLNNIKGVKAQYGLLETCDECDEKSAYYMSEIEAMHYYDGHACTNHLRAAHLAFNLSTDYFIPTLGQMSAIYIYKLVINNILVELGGDTFGEKDYYHTSSEATQTTSFGVEMGRGGVINIGKYAELSVRPCFNFTL